MASIALPSWRGRWSSRPERVAGVFCRRPDLFRKTVPWRADGWDNAEYTMIATGASRLPAMAAAVLMQSHKKSPTDMKQDPRFPNLFITDHPLIQHKLSHMRERDTSTRTFRELLKEITQLMGYEITRDLPLTTRQIETPLMTIDAPVIASKKLAIVPILRAGIGMSDGLLNLVTSACSAIRRPTSRSNTWCACRIWSSGPSSCATRWSPPATRRSTRSTC